MGQNDNVDTVNIRTGFCKMLLSKLICKAIKKRLKNEGIDITFGDIDAIYNGGKLTITITNAEIDVDGATIIELLEL